VRRASRDLLQANGSLEMQARAKTCLFLLAAICAMVVSLMASTSASAANPYGPEIFGIATGGDIQDEDPATLARDLDLVQATGSRWVRVDINWSQIQAKGPSSYEWGAVDRVVEGATARGMKVLGIIVYSPAWHRPAHTDGPDPATYAGFAAKAAAHYSALGVDAYEVWNEPNIGFWTPKPDPAAYAQLLRAAYPAIKAADPEATVLAGATAPASTGATNIAPVEFLRRVYASGGGGYFDAVSHHPYAWPANPGEAQPWSSWYQVYGTNPSLRSVMIDNGDAAKRIWGTEFGAPTGGPQGSHVSEAQQAQMVTRAYELWSSYEWAGPLFTYEGRDLGTSNSTRENFFGLAHHDFTPKPAFEAYRAAALGGSSSTRAGGVIEITVRAGESRGRGRAKGTVRSDAAVADAAASGELELRLDRRSDRGWRANSRWQPAKVDSGGRFRRGLGKLDDGTYRVRVRYLDSAQAKAAARSRAFRVRS
jgi:polysaccharide biosynthesis protein PslG